MQRNIFFLMFWFWLMLTFIITARVPTYPVSEPQVIEYPDSLVVLFPQQVGIVLDRHPGMFMTQIARLWVGSREVLSMPPGYELPPALVMLSEDPVGGITDWTDYLLQREANNYQWPPVGGRNMWLHALDTSAYLGYHIDGDTVSIDTRVMVGDSVGNLQWLFVPVAAGLGLQSYSGIGWKIRLQGIQLATWFHIVEPVNPGQGNWVFAQRWGKWFESQVGSGEPFNMPLQGYFSDMQPFYFAGGGQEVTVGCFEDIIPALTEAQEESGRQFLIWYIPLGTGQVRETPLKMWVVNPQGTSGKWAAVDEWTHVYNTLATAYNNRLGLGTTIPKPTIFWGAPDDDYFSQYHNGEIDTFWLDAFRENELPVLADSGFRVIFFHTPWESDADHPQTDYLPGSGCWGSGNAPWSFATSPAIGGESAMQMLITHAHNRDVKIVLWSSPGHLSNSSPLLVQHPEWIKWRYTGVPEDFDYGDVTGTSQHSGYFDYAIQEYNRTFSELGYDGIWQDSYLTFGVLPDYRERQPVPPLERTLAMQQEFWRMGMTEIYVEGCGPFGLSTGGFGHEPPIPSDLDPIRNKEYGLYRYIADVYPEPAAYYRALASGGVIGVASLEELRNLPADSIALIVQANQDYLRVMDRMAHRKLIASDNTWQGVEWRNDNGSAVVLFAFDAFTYPTGVGTVVQDITTGEIFTVNGALTTEPFHTYLVGDTLTGNEPYPPFSFELQQNYPNPFNGETTLRYQLPQAGRVTLNIYNILGQRVRTLFDGSQKAGWHQLKWDGRTDTGRMAASGVYFYRLRLNRDQAETRKMLLIQ